MDWHKLVRQLILRTVLKNKFRTPPKLCPKQERGNRVLFRKAKTEGGHAKKQQKNPQAIWKFRRAYECGSGQRAAPSRAKRSPGQPANTRQFFPQQLSRLSLLPAC